MLDAIVIGGGVTGLTCAYDLISRNRSTILIEPSEPGGLIRTEERDGFTLECGPNVFLSKPHLVALLNELGIGDRVVKPLHRLYRQHVWYQGSPLRVPKDPVTFCKSPLFDREWKPKILKNVLFGPVPHLPAEDAAIAEFFESFVGPRAVSSLIAPAMKGIYGGSISTLSARTIFPGMWDAGKRGLLFRQYLRERMKEGRGRIFTIKGGMKVLTAALSERCRKVNAVKKGSVARAQREREGFEVELKDGGSLRAKKLFICTSGPSSAAYLDLMLPDLSSQLRRIAYVPLVVVHISVPHDAPLPGKSFGMLFPGEEERKLLGVMFNSLLFPHTAPEGKHLCTVMLGGSGGHDALELSEAKVRDVVAEELKDTLGIVPEEFLQITRWVRAIPEFFTGHYRIVQNMRNVEANFPGIHFAGTDAGFPGVADRVRLAREAVAEAFLTTPAV